VTCREFLDFLADYLAGEVPPESRARFDAHLAACPPCVTYLRTYEQTIALGKAACADDGGVPADVPEELVRAVLAARGTNRDR
jgi:anti-sigma factor RsiW